jgi:DNA-binding response OmpR family regulator
MDLDHNRIIINNIPITTTAQRAEILAVLCEHIGRPVHEERIITKVNGSGYWDMTGPSLRAQIANIRIALKPHAFIDHIPSRGYELRLK